MINSFLCHTLLHNKGSHPDTINIIREDTKCEKVNIPDRQKNISAISLLYQYTNPPPLAYGSPAPKVAESILRSKEYNSLPSNGRASIKYKDTQSWKENNSSEYPFSIHEPTSNICLASMKEYSLDFCKHYHSSIDQSARKLIETIRTENADVLTKGRQTWDPFLRRSVPSPDAFKGMMEFYEKNLQESNFTMLGWIKAWGALFDKDSIKAKNVIINKERRKIFDGRKRMFVSSNKTTTKVKWITLKGEEKNKYLMDIATEFCSYLKSKERSKLKRRAIASANMILRMFFDIIERFHLDLGKRITGSTISTGGIEKRTKIMEGLSTVEPKAFSILATEDATKWNECLAPAGFYIMHYIFFSPEERKKAGIPVELATEDYDLLEHIFSTGIYLLSLKRIYIGKGHVMESETHFTRNAWYGADKEKFNKKTREWFIKIESDLDNRDCVYSPFGMLMGMLNAASTTYGLLAIVKYKNSVSAIRSSDDSITLFSTGNKQTTWNLVKTIYSRYKLIGINISPKKTRFFRWPYGEYTSWYIDGKFSSQYGVETSTIKPKGDTPHTDFHSSAVETNVSLREFRINNFGAEMMLALRIANTRRLWRIEENKREGISDKILLLSDGGKSPWHSTNCHLAEISFKKLYISTEAEKEYMAKVTNIDNPFSSREREIMTYSKELGRIVNEAIDIPRNIFSYVRRPNKTLKDNYKAKMKAEMNAASFIVDICEKIDPAIALCSPRRGIKCGEFMLNCIAQYVSVADSFNDDELISLAAEAQSSIRGVLHENDAMSEDSD